MKSWSQKLPVERWTYSSHNGEGTSPENSSCHLRGVGELSHLKRAEVVNICLGRICMPKIHRHLAIALGMVHDSAMNVDPLEESDALA